MANDDLDYLTGVPDLDVPPFLADAAYIDGYGEFAYHTGGFVSNGLYGVNAVSQFMDTPHTGESDLAYLVNHELKLLSLTKVVMGVHWYTLGVGTGEAWAIRPVISPDVYLPKSGSTLPVWAAAGYNVTNALRLTATHQLYPTASDESLLSGFRFLQGQGYEAAICPEISAYRGPNNDPNKETFGDRSQYHWTSDPTHFASFLADYSFLILHYGALLFNNNLHPWIVYLGSGMWDLTFQTGPEQFEAWITLLNALATQLRTWHPNALITYAADMDEYARSFQVVDGMQYRLDALWTDPLIDRIGINYTAPLTSTDTDNLHTLQAGVTSGEGYDSTYAPAYQWRKNAYGYRRCSVSANSGKTALVEARITTASGFKSPDVVLSRGHYLPLQSGALSGVTPIPGMSAGFDHCSTFIHGTGTVFCHVPPSSVKAPCHVRLPGKALTALPSDPAGLTEATGIFLSKTDRIWFRANTQTDPAPFHEFEIALAAGAGLHVNPATGRVRDVVILHASFGGPRRFIIYYSGGNLCVDQPLDAVDLQVELPSPVQTYTITSASRFRIRVVFNTSVTSLYIDGGLVSTLFTLPGIVNRMPNAETPFFVGGYENDSALNYTGQVFAMSCRTFDGVTRGGGNYFFEEEYCGTRTAWMPDMKGFLITKVTYPSISYGTGEPWIQPRAVMGPTATNMLPSSLEDRDTANGSVYWGYGAGAPQVLVDLYGPYGSSFVTDFLAQANALYAATYELMRQGAFHVVAGVFDTRSYAAFHFQVPRDSGQMSYAFTEGCTVKYSNHLNGKPAVRFGGARYAIQSLLTIDQRLMLTNTPGPLPNRLVIPS